MNSDKKKRLGKGLSGLMRGSSTIRPATGHEEKPTSSGNTVDLAISSIKSNPSQPRKNFDTEKLEELCQSIKHNGIIQPLIVTRSKDDEGGGYTLVAGERRLKAAAAAGLNAVPCVVREANEQQMHEWAIIENIQRADLNPVERAVAYREYIDRFSATQESISERLGVPRSSIANHLRLLELEQETKELVADGKLSFGHAKILAALTGAEDVERQVALARKVAESDMSVRDLEKAMAAVRPEGAAKREKVPYVVDMENQLTEALGTRVTLRTGKKKHTGKIIIEYYSLDDFDRIANILGLDED